MFMVITGQPVNLLNLKKMLIFVLKCAKIYSNSMQF